MAVSTLIFSIVAALGAASVAYWAWVDRPRYAWGVRYEWRRDPKTERVVVRALGTAVARSVEVRVPDQLPQRSSQMSAHDEPITIDFRRPESGEIYAEIYWTTAHPLRRRELGERVNLRSLKRERWRWKWRGSEGCWKKVSRQVTRIPRTEEEPC
ncbi:hypothetical protein [Streptomyces vilmorinianum]|uniref:hypothetical protein n=1 Tax=Streptomyces vilmorinianum TaxID=3051092 RepID=UPI0010FB664B|nr:hypothetical protein [Streptomyces vilmorinianum]